MHRRHYVPQQPTETVFCYCPLDGDILDYSGNNRHLHSLYRLVFVLNYGRTVLLMGNNYVIPPILEIDQLQYINDCKIEIEFQIGNIGSVNYQTIINSMGDEVKDSGIGVGANYNYGPNNWHFDISNSEGTSAILMCDLDIDIWYRLTFINDSVNNYSYIAIYENIDGIGAPILVGESYGAYQYFTTNSTFNPNGYLALGNMAVGDTFLDGYLREFKITLLNQ
jgi:hypothetical protein